MRRQMAWGAWAIGLGLLTGANASAQAPADRPRGDLPGPIDSVSDLQDTGKILFKAADENMDGKISQKEATDAGNLVVGGFFFSADTNGDGAVSEAELKAAREDFLKTKPWVKYAIETAEATQAREGNASNTPENQMKLVFGMIDSNNDKQIQATELRQAVQTTVGGLFATADANRDGQLTPAEVNSGVAGLTRQAAEMVFRQADADKNGQISQAEFEKAVLEPSRVAFAVMDLNHDGQLSPQEAQTARQVVMSRIAMLNVPEPSNSPRNTINAALGTPTAPTAAPTTPAAPR